MDQPWKVIFAFVGVFVAGAIFGGVFTLRASHKTVATAPAAGRAAVQPGRDPSARPKLNTISVTLLRSLTKRVNLTPDQKESVERIMARAGEDLARLRQQHFSDTTRVMERMYVDVSVLLSPEQRSELETMRREAQEKLEAASKKRPEPSVPAALPREKKATRDPGE